MASNMDTIGTFDVHSILSKNNCKTVYWKTGHSHIKREYTNLQKDNFLGCQFHPEFTSDPRSGHPLFTGFIKAAKKNKISK